ncbi:class I SAM-dependent methyltransferase [Streptomyces sp. NBC_01498]|uniref:class I SAM-dependent methyltransferase n=1 Tax=Streptomyces sp. NBC_01498 TaxID=2975870 RepID=UPI002E7C2C2E|nr:class I SAM-dependent methyltransferase [Streptomyces sp. NBC_01498]WTL27651.1 class I SAM-dependent methyltransferase [Streptomyces sp. NBC_01498]
MSRSGSFLVLERISGSAPRTLRFEGSRWFRFMDRVYSPRPVHQLPPEQVRELCELRLARSDLLIDDRLYEKVVRELTATAAAHIGSPGTILDFGTGDGRAIPFYRAAFADSRIHGCDMSAASLRRRDARAQVVQISGDGPLPFRGGTIDLVLAAFVFHFSLPVPLLAEIPRVLRADGALVASVYGPLVPSLASLLRAGGLELVRLRQVGAVPGHFVFTATPAGDGRPE